MADVVSTHQSLPPRDAWNHAARRADTYGYRRHPIDHAYLQRGFIESLASAVRRWPDHPAVVAVDRTLSYRQMWRLATQIGRAVAEANAPPGPVALLLGDYVLCGAAIFAGIIAGRPAVLMDRSHPAERNAQIIATTDAALVVAQAGDTEAMAAAAGRPVLLIDHGATKAGDPPEPLPSRLGIDEAAFIIPTSGSTGEPKLIVLSQRIEAHRLSQFGDSSQLTKHDRFMYCGAPPTSYSGIGCLLIALRVGASAHLINMRREGIGGLLRRMEAERITSMLAPASLVRSFIDLPKAGKALAHLRLLGTGGEALLHSDIAAIRRVLGDRCVLQTGYGATETTNLRWTIPKDDTHDPFRVAVGYPNAGGDFLLLDDDGRVCQPGTPGEIVVRSRYNALGEWRDGRCVPGRLIQDPDEPDCRIYFTGDVARESDDGVFVILGRKDRQLKMNGQRVEPMEIEAALREAPGVRDAIVLPRTEAGGTTLHAFASVGASPDVAAGTVGALREYLKSRLPPYMVPAHIVVMLDLPRLPGGKIDGVTLLAQATA